MSGGDILRHSDNQELQRIMVTGEIIPSDLWEQIVVPVLSSSEYTGRPLILSEVGRLEGEQYVIGTRIDHEWSPTKSCCIVAFIVLKSWRRFDASQKEGDRGARADDNRDVIQARLDSYHQSHASY